MKKTWESMQVKDVGNVGDVVLTGSGNDIIRQTGG